MHAASFGLARDLHDDVMQSLTSLALQVAAADRAMTTDPAHAHAILARVSDEIVGCQRQLRTVIGNLRGESGDGHRIVDLGSACSQLSGRVKLLWDIDVFVTVGPGFAHVDQLTLREIYLIAQEGILNAARHAEARTILVDIRAGHGRATIHVEDDGHGFPYRGVFDLSTLDKMGLGPVVLRERVEALEGKLRLESTKAGARLDITVPIGAR